MIWSKIFGYLYVIWQLFSLVPELYLSVSMTCTIFPDFLLLGGTWLLNCSWAQWPLDVRSGACTDGKTDRLNSQVNWKNKGIKITYRYFLYPQISLLLSYCSCVFSHEIFTTVPRTRTRVTAKKWQRFEWKTDEVTHCLACSREAYVTLTTAVSLSVFTGSKREGLLDSVWLMRGNELLLHLSEASNGKINAVKDPAGGPENPQTSKSIMNQFDRQQWEPHVIHLKNSLCSESFGQHELCTLSLKQAVTKQGSRRNSSRPQ